MAFIKKSGVIYLLLIIAISALVSAQTYNCDPYGDGSQRKYGDLNGDKIIDINDSRIFFEFMVNNSIIPGDKGCLDADGNGIVDFEDNRILNQHIDEGTELGFYAPNNQNISIVNATEQIIQEELKKKQESESGGRRKPKVNNTNTGSNTGIINITDVVNKINEIKEEHPVIFWSIVSVLSALILAVGAILVVLFVRLSRDRNSSAESQLEANYFNVEGGN